MVKLSKESVQNFLNDILGDKVGVLDELKLNDREMEEVEKLVQKHLKRPVGYLVQEQDMHRLLALAYTLEKAPDDDVEVRYELAMSIRKMFKGAKSFSLHEMFLLNSALAAANRDEDAPEDNTDEQAKGDKEAAAGC